MAIPIPKISFTTPDPERARLVTELKELYAARSFDEILTRVDSCLPKDSGGEIIPSEEKSDVVHDLLAFLAEEMLEMNRRKQEEIKGFLRWLEGHIGARVDDLSNKTKVESYFKSDFESLLAVLKKNRRKLSADPARRDFQEVLRREYDCSIEKLLPLLSRIEKTDRLIDQVVYRLYGLTDEEICVVEGV